MVPDLARFLRRFRRAVSPPGRPGPVSVPVDEESVRAEELRDVLAEIDDLAARAQHIRDEADARARDRRAAADAEAEQLLSRARAGAEVARAEAAALSRHDADEAIRSTEAAARQQAEEIRTRAEARLDDLAARVVRAVLEGEAVPEGEQDGATTSAGAT